MKVAILHNPRPPCPDPLLPDDAFEEFDGPQTIAAIARALEGLGVETSPVVADRRLPWTLEEGRFDFVFNIAEGHGRRCREAVPAAVCELLGLPYTLSDPLTLAVTLDKAVARRVVSPEVSVPRGVLVDELGDERQLTDFSYPAIVKPNDEGSSKGIGAGSLCAGPSEAAARCRWLQERYSCPALVEEFLPGAEVTVAVRGNGACRTVLGMMEIALAEPDEPFIYSVEVKRNWRQRVRYFTPARLPAKTLEILEANALTACRLLGCRDLARFDFRLDRDGYPQFLECNPMPGLDPDNSDVVLLSRDTLSYDRLVQGILEQAAARYGMAP